MARYHGRKGRLYIGLASDSAAPEPVAFIKSWQISFKTDMVDVTALGDTNKVVVAGLPDVSGTYAGFWDNATAQMYTAATDGLARKFYLYATTDVAGTYWYGTAFFDFTTEGAVDGAVNINGSFAAAGAVAKVG